MTGTPATQPSQQQVASLLAQAQKRYATQPTDYLEGVITTTMGLLELDRDRNWIDEAAQERDAGSKSAPQRARDYLHGRDATIRWAAGDTHQPPVA